MTRQRAVSTWAGSGGLTGGLLALFVYIDTTLNGQFWEIWQNAAVHAWPAFKAFVLGTGVTGSLTAWARDRPTTWNNLQLTHNLGEPDK